ncbi:hypothetical protein GCM10007160_18650 [Litchfieldella qijiaojingensis]|uniref:Uncharacterized protein n=1 Tax=Litchfieldella qijiaojingensis TaxID=980347 RepID=A0ABQ2YRM5_9GAMM|nr:hypothetical protein [Halomonas qijiaojingensis]GGX91530.1 hypothetical protein GCM10007160_18650 [Halomonas qijiaojingensis]
MSAYELLDMAKIAFNIVGLLVCLAGLSLVKYRRRKVLGAGLAVLGFLIAASPMLAQLFGLVSPPPAPIIPQ